MISSGEIFWSSQEDIYELVLKKSTELVVSLRGFRSSFAPPGLKFLRLQTIGSTCLTFLQAPFLTSVLVTYSIK